MDAKRLLKGNPWIFRNIWLSLIVWDSNYVTKNLKFNQVPLWVKIWDLPQEIITKQMGEKIGVKLGCVQEANIYQYINHVGELNTDLQEHKRIIKQYSIEE